MSESVFKNWSLIDQISRTLTEFSDLLDLEKDALTAQKIDVILALNDRKNDIITQLNQQLEQLKPFDAQTLQQAAQSNSANPERAQQIADFVALSLATEQRNERNQQLLATLYKINSQLLGNLTQARPTSFQGYSQSGLPKKNKSNRSLGEA